MKIIIFILLILFCSCIGNPNGNFLENNKNKIKKECNIFLPLIANETNDNELIIAFYFSCINSEYE